MSLTLHSLADRLKSLDVRHEVVETVRDTANEIAELNREQMSLGLLATGEDIINLKTNSPLYSLWWEAERIKRNLQTDFFDFRVTGEFYRKIDVTRITEDEFEINAPGVSENKTENLLELFGPNIFGLTRESREGFYLPNFFSPRFQQRIEAKLGKVFGP